MISSEKYADDLDATIEEMSPTIKNRQSSMNTSEKFSTNNSIQYSIRMIEQGRGSWKVYRQFY